LFKQLFLIKIEKEQKSKKNHTYLSSLILVTSPFRVYQFKMIKINEIPSLQVDIEALSKKANIAQKSKKQTYQKWIRIK
jgi:hypothetical protein